MLNEAARTEGESEALIAVNSNGWKENVAAMCESVEKAFQEEQRQHGSSRKELHRYYEERIAELQWQKELDDIQQRWAGYDRTRNPPDGAAESTTAANNDDGERKDKQRSVILAMYGSLGLNVFLLCIKLVAALRTGSLTVLASLVDSVLDILSGAILVVVSVVYNRSTQEMYPAGKHYFEPLGTLVFACVMFTSATKLLQAGLDEIANISGTVFEMDTLSLAILVLVIVLKSLAASLCYRYGKHSVSVMALADDHRNDIVANVVAMVAFLGAVHLSPWIDPIAGIAVTFFILKVWFTQILCQLRALSGRVADPAYTNAITMLARNHDARVLEVDTVRAFSAGTGNIVEVDLVLPESMPLREAHDIGESLQHFLETTPCLHVSRAYVHLDYETAHDPKRHL